MSTIDTLNFSIIEAAIKAQLRAEVTALKTVETYAGQLIEAMEGKALLFPAAFVVFNGETFAVIDGPSYQHDSDWSIVVAAESFKGGDEVRTGATGAYEIVQECQRSLINSRLSVAASDDGSRIDKIQPVSTKLVAAKPTFTAYAFNFNTTYDTTFENWDE